MEFLDRFAWAVPATFLDFLGQCRFERGHRIYSSPSAFDSGWRKWADGDGPWVQVTFPEGGGGAAPTSEDGPSRSVFRRNWKSEVRVRRFVGERELGSEIVTQQGRLYTLLWKGDPVVLDDAHPLPEPPGDAAAMVKLLRKGVDLPVPVQGATSAFFLVVDRATPRYRSKQEGVESAVRAGLSSDVREWTPEDLRAIGNPTFRPTVHVAEFATTFSARRLHDLVKQAVYEPSPNAKKPQFRIQAHGALWSRDAEEM